MPLVMNRLRKHGMSTSCTILVAHCCVAETKTTKGNENLPKAAESTTLGSML